MYYSNIEMIRKTKLKSTIQIEFKQQLDKIKMKLNELKRTMTNNNNRYIKSKRDFRRNVRRY